MLVSRPPKPTHLKRSKLIRPPMFHVEHPRQSN